ncbi:MAG TPA: hypothetical protein VJ455_11120 [Ignavibacteria bacterium]|nr:hypothetical protein [Ignavibacteria bacterium]
MFLFYSIVLICFSAWGYWSGTRIFKSAGGWARQRALIFITGLLFGTGCLIPAIALLTGHFTPILLLPLSISFFVMIIEPCYFDVVNSSKIILIIRNIFYALAGFLFLGTSFELIPLKYFGL